MLTMQGGLFITFEGIDGTGKSTQLSRAVRYIRKSGYRVLVSREPGGTPTGERIREILLASKTGKLAPLTELALMYAARAQLLEELIHPALARGEVVVSDRFNTASFAYQGYGRELGTAAVRAFDRVICGVTQPDLTIILDLDPKVAMDRAIGRGTRDHSKLDRIEAQGLAFHRRVRAGYLAIARKHPEQISVVSADQTIDAIEEQIRALVEPCLARRRRSTNAGQQERAKLR